MQIQLDQVPPACSNSPSKAAWSRVQARNWNTAQSFTFGRYQRGRKALLSDPQTSGDLLVAYACAAGQPMRCYVSSATAFEGARQMGTMVEAAASSCLISACSKPVTGAGRPAPRHHPHFGFVDQMAKFI
jgi:hypothetical protein